MHPDSPREVFSEPNLPRRRNRALRSPVYRIIPIRRIIHAAPIVCALLASINLAAQQSPNASAAIISPSFAGDASPTRSTGTSPALPTGAADLSSSPGTAGEPADELPDAPQTPAKVGPETQSPTNSDQSQRDPQTRRILGIIPNFRAISTDEKLPAQSVKDKFVTATQDSFDYSSIFIPALLAYYSLETNATPEFGQGAVGYGRYFWHSAVDQTSENYMVEFVVPAITHEDTRYYTLGRGGFLKRTGYALSRAVVTRSDAGNEVFNVSEVVGAGASAGLSSLYYPTRERSIGATGTEWGLDVAIDAASFVAKEFWPDINHWLFHGGKLSAPSVPGPEPSKVDQP